MWKKIHSNRNVKHTLPGELYREFEMHLQAVTQGVKRFLQRKPGLVLGVMIMLLASSAVLSFTCFRNRAPDMRSTPAKPTPVSEGFTRLKSTTAKLRETIRLKGMIDSITLKTKLGGSDSLDLNQALDSLSALQKSLNHSSYEH